LRAQKLPIFPGKERALPFLLDAVCTNSKHGGKIHEDAAYTPYLVLPDTPKLAGRMKDRSASHTDRPTQGPRPPRAWTEMPARRRT
jgi:hypothetical protein